MQYSQEHLKTMVYAKFGGQTECIMGNWKIENNIDLLQVPQIFKLNLANKKDQVSFGSNRDNVNQEKYCTENKQALPRTPH